MNTHTTRNGLLRQAAKHADNDNDSSNSFNSDNHDNDNTKHIDDSDHATNANDNEALRRCGHAEEGASPRRLCKNDAIRKLCYYF